MLIITSNIVIPDSELEMHFIRSPGPGGQNVNKLATAVQLRYNISLSTALDDVTRQRLLSVLANRLTQQGEIIIKANRYRTQERNKFDALQRLQETLRRAVIPPKKRKKTKPTKASQERRIQQKKLHAKTKTWRSKKINKED